MIKNLKKLTAGFYRTKTGKEPVRDWLKKLSDKERKIIGQDIATIEYTWPVGMPLCRSFKKSGLWEIRSNLDQKRISRVLFFILGKRMILIHGFIKKAQKTPLKDLQLAETRMKEVLKHEK
ncbi:MAG: type II toxin-antitoxin system RelE/ParE family toxin [Deltaproteobacteria bacterium]|nr:type II toxin-antitoxin system RelE/ParE family toxin [Deltaproteobacteria bacterium]